MMFLLTLGTLWRSGYITTYDIMGNGIEDNEAYDDLPEQDKWKAFPKAPVREFFDRWVRLYEKLIRMVAPTRDPGHTSHGDTGEWFSRDGSVVDEDKLLELDNDEGVIGIDEDDNMLAEYREVTAVSHNNRSARLNWCRDRVLI